MRDLYNEVKICDAWNKVKPWRFITLTNKEDKFLIYDGEDKKGNKYEMKSLRDSYQNGEYETVLMPVSKVGCFGILTMIYEFYDAIYYIRYSHHKFKNIQIKHINGRRHFIIPKRELSYLCRNY